MLKKWIRFIFILTAGLVLTAMLAGSIVSRILGLIIVVYLVFFIIGRIGSRTGSKDSKQEKAPERESTVEGAWREVHDDGKTVDGTWREVKEEEKKRETVFTDPKYSGTLQDNIREISKAADGIQHSKIREQAFHVLIIAKDIIREYVIEHNPCRNYNQFENYYVPTVKSVIKNYHTMESKGMATEKMQEDVLSYLESCGDAFTKLYNSMFSDDIMGMAVRMEAMNITMKRDGLL